jgi:hypothetical protein
MVDELKFDFAERRSWLEGERDLALERLPAARQEYERALRAHEDAQSTWNAFCVRLNRAFAHTDQSNQVVTVTATISDIIADQRAEYHRAGAALSKAKATLADLRWTIQCRNLDLEQLGLLETPARSPIVKTEPRLKVVDDDFDVIIPPSGSRAA